MRSLITILSLLLVFSLNPSFSTAKEQAQTVLIDFYGDTLQLPFDKSLNISYGNLVCKETVQNFHDSMNAGIYQPTVDALLAFKQQYSLSDWFYYQLIRKTAQAVSAKEVNYPRYTLYKWFLLAKSGYDANIAISDSQLIFYVRSEENIYDIPYYTRNGKHYVCLNIHDYAGKSFNFEKDGIFPTDIKIPEGQKTFSYRVTQMPDFSPSYYSEKDIKFSYEHKLYRFKVMINPQLQTIFANYPVVDFESYFNIPLTRETYNSLIPELKKVIAGMSQEKGVDYLMEFSRNAFPYKDDKANFGKEKRLSPELTLINRYSDCDDRAAFFFYLVKEIYNLPMIALLYPTHVTIAIKFDHPQANSINYNGDKYAICDPTSPYLAIGEGEPELKSTPYEVAYAYDPKK